MSLQSLAAKLRNERLATATTAAPATEARNRGGTVADVAGLAVAVPQTAKIDLSPAASFDVPRALSNADAERLKQAAQAFRAGPFAVQAEALGWDEISLFGVHMGSHPKERMDAWGLIPSLAWTVLSLTLAKMEADVATLASPRGSILGYPRKRGCDQAVPYWAHPAFVEEGAV